MAYVFLVLAIVFEVVGTLALRWTVDDTGGPWVWLLVTGAYALAFVALQQSLARGLPLGVTYAAWAGLGILLIAVCSRWFFDEHISPVQLAGMACVIAGVVMLELGHR
ncbi:MAG: SMR family transporter [Ornithinimicrobium sp.]